MKQRGDSFCSDYARPPLKNNQGQVWVETVIYTLIALTVIGLFLSVAKPKIEEFRDKALVEQSAQSLDILSQRMQSVAQGGVGNRRLVDLSIKKGSFTLNPGEDSLSFELAGAYIASEPGTNGAYGSPARLGNAYVQTKTRGDEATVKVYVNYSGTYNVTNGVTETMRVLGSSPTPYTLSIENNSSLSSGTPQLSIRVQ